MVKRCESEEKPRAVPRNCGASLWRPGASSRPLCQLHLALLMDELRLLTSFAVEIRYPGTSAERQDAEHCWQTAFGGPPVSSGPAWELRNEMTVAVRSYYLSLLAEAYGHIGQTAE